MKKIIHLSFIFFLTIQLSTAQSNVINIEDCTINGHVLLGKSSSTLTKIFGTPKSIQDFYFEMDGVMSKKYIFNGIQFYVINDKIYSFEISSNNYLVSKNNIRIGNHIRQVNSYYPISYANRKNSGIKLEIDGLDRFVIISYQNDIIDKISIYSY